MRVEWTEIALEDLAGIRDHIARDSPYYARQFIEKILTACENLERHPKLGRRVPEIDRDNIRELIYRNYRIIYLATASKVQILTVIHASRELARRATKPWAIV